MFTLNADVAYLDSKYRDYTNGVCTMEQTALIGPACVQDLTGKRRPYSPEFSGNIGASIALPLAGRLLRVDPLVYFTSRFFTVATADPLLQQPGYAKYDLRVGYGPEDERWEVAVIGRNLADKATAAYRNPLTGGNGSTFAYPDPPRTVAVQFSIKN
jgi:outer membrane receptor protein involved in Fe transport